MSCYKYSMFLYMYIVLSMTKNVGPAGKVNKYKRGKEK